MAKILVCQHVPYEPLGTFNPLLKQYGLRIRYVNFGRFPDLQPSLKGYGGLVILGGPMCLDQMDRYPHLKHEVQMVEEAMRLNIPVLGICLGAQVISHALGARVYPNEEKEIGWYDVRLTDHGLQDPVLKKFSQNEKIFQWHGDTFDLPRGAKHLASTTTCDNQAFVYGCNVYGFQFHMEVDEAMISRWLRVPRHVEELQALEGKIDPDQILAETPRHIDRLKELSETTFGEFIKLLGVEKKYICPPSR